MLAIATAGAGVLVSAFRLAYNVPPNVKSPYEYVIENMMLLEVVCLLTSLLLPN